MNRFTINKFGEKLKGKISVDLSPLMHYRSQKSILKKIYLIFFNIWQYQERS